MSQQQSTKKPSIVFRSPSSEDSAQDAKFGAVQSHWSHSFCQRTHMWATVQLLEERHYDSSSGLWHSCNSSVAYDDSYVWFLDACL